MCLITFHIGQHDHYKLVLAANRDEAYNRPSIPAHFWESHPQLLAGKDLEANGTWLGVTKQGKIAAITNCHGEEYSPPKNGKKSRGKILLDYLKSDSEPVDFLEQLIGEKDSYQPFNVLLGTVDGLYHYNSREANFSRLEAGTHSLSNATLNTPWPKVRKTKAKLDELIQMRQNYQENLFELMMDQTPASDQELPKSNLPIELRRKASASFIKTAEFGTRSTTLVLVDWDNNLTFVERTYAPDASFEEQSFSFQIK